MSDSVRPRVVVAEDDAIIRLDLAEMLREEGYEVFEAADGETAVALARATSPDLVILDIKMPGKDGIEAASEISEEWIAPVLILTAYSQRELVERATEAGAMAYLVKPFQRRDLLPAVEVAKARFQQLTALVSEVGGLNQQLEARKTVERAKGVLMDRFGLREAAAYRFIRQSAMRRRLPMADVAQAVLDGHISPEE
ncbi:MAG: response regulator [Actinomycetota bacterium]